MNQWLVKNKSVVNTFLFVLAYGVFFTILQVFLHQRDMAKLVPTAQILSTYDAGWYKEIAEKGYIYTEGKASNSAFYPLLPLIWRWFHLGPWGMSFFNLVFFAAGIAVFSRVYKSSMAEKFIIVSVPSLYFCFIPYTEALFILLMSLVFLAMKENRKYLLWVSLFLLSLSRPISMILLPAYLITEVITNRRQDFLKGLGSFFVKYGLPMILAQALFIYYQYYETGEWFAFFRQEENWGHVFAWPTFPLNNMYGPRLLWIDALAIFIGCISLLFLIQRGWNWLWKNRPAPDKILTVSFLYLTGIMFVTLLFNPIWGTWTTNIYDIHRYAFCTPFFLVFLHHFAFNRKYKVGDYFIVVLLSNACWLMMGSYLHIMHVVYFQFCTGFIILYMLLSEKKLTWPPLAVAALNVLMQVWMYQFFLEGHYPG
jgi:hypothetical protein